MLVKLTQEIRIKRLLEADGGWLSTAYFEQFMTTSAFHRAIWNLENKMGVKIEHGARDERGFKTYRIVKPVYKPVQTPMFNVNNYV